MTTATKSFTAFELLGSEFPEGTKAKVTTDNDLYGTTIVKKKNILLNDRNGLPLALTADLLTTKFKLVVTEEEVSLPEFLNAYKAGKQVKIVVGERMRILHQPTEEMKRVQELLNQCAPPELRAVAYDEVVTIQELTEGSFYIVE